MVRNYSWYDNMIDALSESNGWIYDTFLDVGAFTDNKQGTELKQRVEQTIGLFEYCVQGGHTDVFENDEVREFAKEALSVIGTGSPQTYCELWRQIWFHCTGRGVSCQAEKIAIFLICIEEVWKEYKSTWTLAEFFAPVWREMQAENMAFGNACR